MKRITFDFETRSTCDLKKSGAYKYSLDPTTQPTCLAYKSRGRTESVGLLTFEDLNRPWASHPLVFRRAWINAIEEGWLFTAHNAFFETCIYKNILVKRYGWPDIPFRQFRCTAAKAAACALPRSLEGAGSAMALAMQKDKRGHAAVMATCKPTKQHVAFHRLRKKLSAGERLSEANRKKAEGPEPPRFLERSQAPEIWQTLEEYCKIDVLTEEELDEALPDLIPFEQELWFLNQRINWRGLLVDVPTIRRIVRMMEADERKQLKELDSLTMGLVTRPGARQSILDFLKLEGIEIPDIRAKTVEDALQKDSLTGDMRKLLELRKALSKTSTRKYQAFLDRVGADNRVRDIILFNGASTGRDSGTGIQPQNFPRGLIKVDKDRPYAAVENIIRADSGMLKILYGDNLSVLFSAVLRNMIMASPGHELFVGDFAKIEVAVLWWLADNKEGLRILREGKDPYIYQAAANLGKTYAEVEGAVALGEKWAEDARQLGKAQVLGCGFGMGWAKFLTTAYDMYRLNLTEEQSRAAVKSYRETNSAVPELWKAYETAALFTIETGIPVTTGKCKFFYRDEFLWVRLPSGRSLAYRHPQFTWRETEFGPRKTVEFFAVNSKTKKWGVERTWGDTLAENITQAFARDIMKRGEYTLESKGYRVLLSVHDELICEKKEGTGSLSEFLSLMCTRPVGADAKLPLDAKGWKGPRYRK